MENGELEKEYTRINSDFDLAMHNQEKLSAILGILVEKHNLTTEDIKKLRGM